MKALILAAGLGTRIRPLTHILPKAMLPLFGVPIIEHIVRQLRGQGILLFLVNLHHMPRKVIDHLQDGRNLGVEIRYSFEPAILGTAGAIKKLEKELGGATFLVVNGDTIRPMDLEDLMGHHRTTGKPVTLLLQEEARVADSRCVFLDHRGEVTGFSHLFTKEATENDRRCQFLGVQVVEPDVLPLIPPGTFWEAQRLWADLLLTGKGLAGHCQDGYWMDLGTAEAYVQVHKDLLEGKARGLIPGKEVDAGIWMEENVSIGKGVTIIPPVFLGKAAVIKERSKIGPYAVLGQRCELGYGSRAERCIIWSGVKVEPKTVVREEILSPTVRLFVPWSSFVDRQNPKTSKKGLP